MNPETYIYLERYVNVGSSSGFTDVYTTSPDTRPKSPRKCFFVCAPKFQGNVTAQDFGTKPTFFQKWQMLVHPDMIKDDFFSTCSEIDHEAVVVCPTSSARTVMVKGKECWFMKLHYKGLIGRFDRRIGVNNAQSAIEVSEAISETIQNGNLPKSFYLWRETFARVIRRSDTQEDWGIVLREPSPYPQDSNIALLVPGFSLFSPDMNHPNDSLILTQLVMSQSKAVEDFLLDDLLFPVFDAYFALLLKCGLELEAQA